LVAAIKRLAGDVMLRQRLSTTARRIAMERHDSAVVRAGFQSVLAISARESARG